MNLKHEKHDQLLHILYYIIWYDSIVSIFTFNVCNKSATLTGGNSGGNVCEEHAIAKAVACSISSILCLTAGTCPSESTTSVGVLQILPTNYVSHQVWLILISKNREVNLRDLPRKKAVRYGNSVSLPRAWHSLANIINKTLIPDCKSFSPSDNSSYQIL